MLLFDGEQEEVRREESWQEEVAVHSGGHRRSDHAGKRGWTAADRGNRSRLRSAVITLATVLAIVTVVLVAADATGPSTPAADFHLLRRPAGADDDDKHPAAGDVPAA